MGKRKRVVWLIVLVALLAACVVASAFLVVRVASTSQQSQSPAAASSVSDRTQEPLSESFRTEASSEDVSQETQDASLADGQDAPTADEGFGDDSYVIPSDAEYDPEVVLVSIPSGMSAVEVEAMLLETGVVGEVHVSDDDIASGVVAVEVSEGVLVEDAITEIRSEHPELEAQPNFYYHAMLGDEGDFRALLEESSEPIEASGQGAEEDQQVADGEAAAPEDVQADSEETPQDVQAETSEDDVPVEPAEDASADKAASADQNETLSEESEAEPVSEAEPKPEEQSQETLMEALSVTTNDPYADKQWALASMQVFEAWSVARCEGKVAIAVLDQTPDVTHEDLASNVAFFYDVHADSATMGSVKRHGTHVTGVASATSDNALGVSGVSYNATLLVMNVFDSSGNCSTNDLCKAYSQLMGMAKEQNLHVINLSLGGKVSSPDFVDDAFLASVDKAFEEYDIVTVAAAANSSSSAAVPYYEYPGDAERVVSVMNLRQSGDGVERSTTSNYNVPGQRGKDICAPGSSIYSTVLNNSYGYESGTSMAAPMVSGVLALEFAANPRLTAAEAVGILYNTATDLGDPGWDEGYGYGEVNAHAAVLTANPLQGADIVVSPARFSYTGAAHTPDVTVTVGGKALVEGEDYSVSFANNVNAGTATVTVVSETYGGSASATFVIDPVQLEDAGVTLSATSFSYTGSAIKPGVKVVLGGKTLANGTDYTVSYRNNVAVGTATAVVTGKGNYAGTIEKTFEITANPCVEYCAHVQNVGWQGWMSDGGLAGTSGQSLRLEAIRVRVPKDVGLSGSILYRTHIQNVGWETSWKEDGELSGTSGRGLRLEALQIKLSGDLAAAYDVYYRVHAQNFGWLGWAKNGESAGTAGHSYRLEALQVVLVKKGAAAPGSTNNAFAAKLVSYRTHVQNVGWQGYVSDGATSGTSGRSLRLEGINIQLGSLGYGGSIRYRTHVQNIGWQGWRSDGSMAGTSGQSLRLEAIQIQLTGDMAQRYDVYYRVHCQNIGWMGWAKNGSSAGTAGYAYRLEAIQIRLVPKGGAAPGPTSGSFRER